MSKIQIIEDELIIAEDIKLQPEGFYDETACQALPAGSQIIRHQYRLPGLT